ncbi:UNVERIFIED_CONTAM: hypothetical protein PYX00_005975 [Menopon gallinae]|uniref:Protein YIPF n=1 Tax=Menopon gallinae TaxID=328185 RepID=A0AAW2HU43_9NEOP
MIDMEDTKLDFQTHTFHHVPDSPGGSDNQLIDENPSSKSFWSFDYYKQFFDVDTDQVKNRIIWGMIPRPGVNYVHSCIKPNPDLYGPFWICVTLVFTIAVSGNVANYLQYAPTGEYKWKYDFHIISFAATAIFLYAFMVPLALWSFIKWNNKSQSSFQEHLSFLELLCVYGYSLGIYVPVAILWVIQISWFQWILVLLGAALSGFVLLTAVSPAVEGPKKILVLMIVIGLHFLLAVGFMLYFFHVPVKLSAVISNDTDSPNLIPPKH